MDQIRSRREHLKQALTTLTEIIQAFEKNLSALAFIIVRDSMIKRFEYSYEEFWKYLKEYISTVHGLVVASPKTTFRGCLDIGLISPEEAEMLLLMVDDRNNTIHRYDEVFASTMVHKIPNYCELMKSVVARTEKKT